VRRIDDYAFYASPRLTAVTLPASVTTIGSGAFESCVALKTVSIGGGVTDIGFRAFARCTSLTIVTIPASVTTIGNSAFAECKNLKNLGFLGSPPTVSWKIVPTTTVVNFRAVDVTWNPFVGKTFGGGPTMGVVRSSAAGVPSVTRGNGSVSLRWAPPVTRGGPITNYVVQVAERTAAGLSNWRTVTRPASPLPSAVVGGLVNGRQYVFRVAAVNIAGTGTFSGGSTVVTPGV
jgi:hypothetical protein